MVSLIHISLALALLIPPLRLPPPPELMAAAAELRRVAPLPAATKDAALDRAILRAAGEALGDSSKQKDYYEILPHARERIRHRLAGIRPDIEARVGGCLNAHLGYGFDLVTLEDMKNVVGTKGGRALWERALEEPAQVCYDETVSELLRGFGFTQAILWLAEHKLLARVPRYDALESKEPVFGKELETLCGRSARGVLQFRQGQSGISSAWIDRDIKRGKGYTSFCLLQAAKVAGYEMRVFEP